MSPRAKKTLKYLRNALIIIVLAIVMFFAVNIIYLFISYGRIDDNQKLEVSNTANSKTILQNGIQYTALTYNTGFSAYLPDYSFFMDGGSESWAKSKESVIQNTTDIANFVASQNVDFVGLQEVDSDSDRTYHVNEVDMIRNTLGNYSDVNACCFNSPFLFWPLLQPHGASKSNIMTLSKFNPIGEALRRQLPVDPGITKILDYDRCYSITRYETTTGKELVWYTTHMSAYSKDPTTSNSQIQMLVEDMQKECTKGNYVICAADFNKQIVENPGLYYPASKIKDTKPFPLEYLQGTDIRIINGFNPSVPVGTCRYAGAPVSDATTVSNIDGFLVSSNIKVTESHIIDTGFAYSDHNPVYMSFRLL